MKKMKKILAFVMAMAMVLGMSVTSFAEGENTVTGTVEDRGTITVKGIQKETGENFGVYAIQVVKAKYNASTGYFASDYESLFPDQLTITNKQLVETDLFEKLGNIKKNIVHNGTTWTGTAGNNATPTKESEKDTYGDYFDVIPMTYDESTKAYSASVAVGSYLIYVEGAEAKFYSPILVSASYVAANDGSSTIEGGNLDIENGTTHVKVSTTPTFEKEATVPSGNTDGKSVNVGDDITYTVTVKNIPEYDGKNPIFNVTDTLSPGLDIIYTGRTEEQFKGSIVVKVGELNGTADSYTVVPSNLYKITVDGTNKRKFTVDFVLDDGSYGLTGSDYTGKALTITYTAKVNADAKMNSEANTNDAVLNYSKDSNIQNNGDTIPAKTYNYTFDLSAVAEGSKTNSMVNKVGTISETQKVALPGAEFTLYTAYNNGTCSEPYDTPIIPNGVVVSGNGEANNPVAGALVMRGLAAGTYYLQETTPPAGYSLNTDVYKIEINAQYYKDTDTDKPQDKNVGELKSWEVRITNLNDSSDTGKTASFGVGAGSTNTSINVEIPNTKLSSLPSTGGIGTTIFTIGGCAIMILAAGLYFASRRKSAK